MISDKGDGRRKVEVDRGLLTIRQIAVGHIGSCIELSRSDALRPQVQRWLAALSAGDVEEADKALKDSPQFRPLALGIFHAKLQGEAGEFHSGYWRIVGVGLNFANQLNAWLHSTQDVLSKVES